MPERNDSAPHIPGYDYVRTIGRGGFSDVFLYTQQMPFREVAIKVLRTEALNAASRRQFTAEANLMARLSNHTNIASIYAADIDEEGEPYLVMEYCSGGSLGDSYRSDPLPIRDVLKIGVRLSGALEAAHRAGIVHRDIKPANILLTEYGVPVLSDFGISTIDEEFPEATMARAQVYRSDHSGDPETSIGLSLPWAAPESLDDPPISDTRSDRYSLAATLYSLIEGRSPHEIPGGPNGPSHLTGRIQSGFIGTMLRPDVPASLEAVLRQAMSFDRSNRFPSSIAFGEQLQQVQRELGHDVTPLDVPQGYEPAAKPPDPAIERSNPTSTAQVVRIPIGHPTVMPGQDAAGGDEAPPGTPSPHTPTTVPDSLTALADRTHIAQMPPPPPGSVPHAGPGSPVGPPAQVNEPAAHTPHAGAVALRASLPAAADTPSGNSRSRRRTVLLSGALLLVASLIVGGVWALTRPPEVEVPPIEAIEIRQSQGLVHVAVPAGLQAPEDVQTRTVRNGLGSLVEAEQLLEVSVGHTSWLPGYEVSIDPDASQENSGTIWMTVEELNETLGVSLVGENVDSVILVVAPRHYFAENVPDLRIDYPHSQLAAIRIIGAN